MAIQPNTDLCARWELISAFHQQLTASLNQAPRDQLSDRLDQLAAVQSCLLTLPAPHLGAVLEKLAILFEGQLVGDHEDAVAKRGLLADLQRLSQGAVA